MVSASSLYLITLISNVKYKVENFTGLEIEKSTSLLEGVRDNRIKEDSRSGALNIIDAQMLSKMFLAGAKNLSIRRNGSMELNVFPVPDGDTGTNMSMTIMSKLLKKW